MMNLKMPVVAGEMVGKMVSFLGGPKIYAPRLRRVPHRQQLGLLASKVQHVAIFNTPAVLTSKLQGGSYGERPRGIGESRGERESEGEGSGHATCHARVELERG